MQIEKFEKLIDEVSQIYDNIGRLTIGDLNSQKEHTIAALKTLSAALGVCKDKTDFILRIMEGK